MTWCDKLSSIPVVGLKLDWTFATGEKFLDALTPSLAKLSSNDAPAFRIELIDALNMVVTTNEGFQYSATPGAISVGFARRIKVKHASTLTPSLEILSLSEPYSVLLDKIIDRLIEFALRLPEAQNRSFNRIGIVTMTSVDETEFPPGIRDLADFFARPWKGELSFYDVQATVSFPEGDNWIDRCIHRVSKVDGVDVIPVMNFDWQRNFKSDRPLHRVILENEITAAQKSALDYFEKLAEGTAFNEDVIGRPTP